jgi:uncharacterized protein YjbI with pentapeptide repeats
MNILLEGAKSWNSWRKKEQIGIPDLSGAELVKMELAGVNLAMANLTNVNFTRSDLSEANLTLAKLVYSKLEDARLQRANLSNATLNKVNLTSADLECASFTNSVLNSVQAERANFNGCDFSDAKIRNSKFIMTVGNKSNFKSASLINVDFSGSQLKNVIFSNSRLTNVNLSSANIYGSVFKDTIFRKVIFSSRTSLNDIREPLTSGQMLGAIFLDEQKSAKSKTKAKKSAQGKDPLPLPVLKFQFSRDEWTPEKMSLYLFAVQVSMDKFVYLTSETSQDQDVIWKTLSGRCYRNYSDMVHVSNIHSGTLRFNANFNMHELFSKQKLQAMVLFATLCGGGVSATFAFNQIQQGLYYSHFRKTRGPAPQTSALAIADQYAHRELADAHKRLQGSVVLPPQVIFENPIIERRKEAFACKAAHPFLQIREMEKDEGESVQISLEGAEPWEQIFAKK